MVLDGRREILSQAANNSGYIIYKSMQHWPGLKTQSELLSKFSVGMHTGASASVP